MQSERMVDALRNLHLAVAAEWQSAQPLADPDLDDDDEPMMIHRRPWISADDWLETLPLGWLSRWSTEQTCDVISPAVALQFVQILTAERDRAEGAVILSWLEFVFLLDLLGFDHPSLVSLGGNTCWRTQQQRLPAQDGPVTCAARLRFAQLIFKLFVNVCGVEFDQISGIDVSRLRVHPPQTGLSLFISRSAQNKIDEKILNWTLCRPVRSTNDLARPI